MWYIYTIYICISDEQEGSHWVLSNWTISVHETATQHKGVVPG